MCTVLAPGSAEALYTKKWHPGHYVKLGQDDLSKQLNQIDSKVNCDFDKLFVHELIIFICQGHTCDFPQVTLDLGAIVAQVQFNDGDLLLRQMFPQDPFGCKCARKEFSGRLLGMLGMLA